MKTTKPKLYETINGLIVSGCRDHRVLGRGLRLAYTPPEPDKTTFRLCLSRKDGKPSQFEADTVWAHLCRCEAVKRPFARVTWGYDGDNFVIEWVTVQQMQMFAGGGAKKSAGGYENG